MRFFCYPLGLNFNQIEIISMSKQPLKTGEKILFSTFAAFFVLAAIGYVVLETVRLNMDGPMFKETTFFVFSEEGKLGSLLYREANCNACHRALRSGTSMGLSLDGLGSKRTVEWIEAFLQSPESAEKLYGAALFDHGGPNQEATRDLRKISKEDKHLIAVFISELKADAGSSVAKVPPAGRSPFIDSMIGSWAPENWKDKYEDIRVRLKREEALKQQDSLLQDSLLQDNVSSEIESPNE